MNNMDYLINEMVRKESAEIDRNIEEAFKKHFGFPIQDVDPKEIKHIVFESDLVESFMFRGETFLFMERPNDYDIKYDDEHNNVNVSYNLSFNHV